ncbi:ATP-dependent DNA ligase, partial [Rhodotorula sp. JG-1b]
EEKREGRGSGQAAENLGQVVLSDSDDDDPKDPAQAQDSGDDLVIIEPTPSTSKVKLDADSGHPPPPPEKIASIFAPKRRLSASTSPQKSVAATTTPVKAEVYGDLQLDKKPDVKPSPSKNISIFDTAAATSGSGDATGSSSAANKNLPLDTSLFSFHPLTDISFSPHVRVPFSFFTDALVLISSTKSRLYIQLVLTNLLRTVIEHDPASLVSVIYLCSNRIGPSYEPQTELGMGWQVLSKSIKETSGATPQKLKQLANKYGDPGDIAFDASKSVRLLVQPAPLLCHSVYATLLQIARLKGTGVLNQKTSLVKKLLLSATGEQVRYIVRILASNLRIGAVRLSLLSALARAFVVSRPPGKGPPLEAQKSELELAVEDKFKRAEQLVRRVWAKHPNFGHLVEALLEGGLEELEERIGLSVGVPLEPMLGSITRSFDDIYNRLGSRPFVSEAKLDGQRGQIHVWVGDKRPPGVADNAGKWFTDEETGKKIWVRMFSRHLEDMSEKYPDIGGTILGIVQRAEATETRLRNFVIDCEVVAIDPVSGAFKTFQELSYRSKKDVELGDIKVRVGIFCFDLMFLNDESLLSTPFRGRRRLLHTHFPPLRPTDPRYAKWELIPSCTDTEPDKVRAFFHEALKMKAEGIMVKLLDEVEVEVEVQEGQQDGELGDAVDEEENGYASSESRSTKSPSPVDVKSGAPEATNGAGTTDGRKGKSRRKVLPATYEPDKRADSWLKVKKDYLEGEGAISDSLDLVPIAAWWGQGRKAGWWSPFLLAVYDEETGVYTAVTKCLSGFTDAFYKEMREKYRPDPENLLTSDEPWPEVDGGSLRPDIWFKPSEVWEIRGADFTLSPVYPAARSLLGERGCSIRFPRFMKVREDKAIENATTAEQLARMYHMQGEPAGGPSNGSAAAAVAVDVEEEEEEIVGNAPA